MRGKVDFEVYQNYVYLPDLYASNPRLCKCNNGSVELNPETKAIMSSYSAEIKQARQVDDVVFFEITLTLIDMQQNKREWTVLRRYSQFDALRSQLEKDLGIKVPKHPGLHLLDA